VQNSEPQAVFFNLEYLFFQVYNATIGFFKYIFSADFFFTLKMFATILAILLIALIIYCIVRIYEMEQGAKQTVVAPSTPNTGANPPLSPVASIKRDETWEAVRAKLLSENPSDWRLAIIEADIYLDKLLDIRGFHGDTISDKFKQITTGDLASINLAWEAHKVRNRIAHEGTAFTLTQPEARRVLSYYEIVFRDFGIIE
jgi:hypothetical protein